jgi:hypothetical protein
MAASTITRTAITDDDGTGTTGTILNNAWKTELYNQIDAMFSGALTLGSTLTVTGALTLTNGQLVFPAVQNASTNVNTLDDYEEGTWTPTFVSSGGGVPTYSTPTNGYYLKVGKHIEAQGVITLSALGTLAAGQMSIGGLPFAAGSGTGEGVSAAVSYWVNLATAKVMVGMRIDPSGTTIALTALGAAAVSSGTLDKADLTATTQISFCITYRAAN